MTLHGPTWWTKKDAVLMGRGFSFKEGSSSLLPQDAWLLRPPRLHGADTLKLIFWADFVVWLLLASDLAWAPLTF